jgi:cytochrome c553
MAKGKFLLFLIPFWNIQLFGADIPKLFKEVCANCHGEHGEKNDAFKIIAGQDIDELVKSLKLYKDGGDKYGMGVVMEGRVEDLTDEDILEMAKYVHSLKAE